MHRLNFGAGSDSQKRPRDVFDMITGVGTGGYVELSPSALLILV